MSFSHVFVMHMCELTHLKGQHIFFFLHNQFIGFLPRHSTVLVNFHIPTLKIRDLGNPKMR